MEFVRFLKGAETLSNLSGQSKVGKAALQKGGGREQGPSQAVSQGSLCLR